MLEECSLGQPSLSPNDTASPLDKDLMNGIEFFLTNVFPTVGCGFGFPPYFHNPFLPSSFHSLYDLSAKTQFTTLEDFPPLKKIC
jgi:hypothetical protein